MYQDTIIPSQYKMLSDTSSAEKDFASGDYAPEHQPFFHSEPVSETIWVDSEAWYVTMVFFIILILSLVVLMGVVWYYETRQSRCGVLSKRHNSKGAVIGFVVGGVVVLILTGIGYFLSARQERESAAVVANGADPISC